MYCNIEKVYWRAGARNDTTEGFGRIVCILLVVLIEDSAATCPCYLVRGTILPSRLINLINKLIRSLFLGCIQAMTSPDDYPAPRLHPAPDLRTINTRYPAEQSEYKNMRVPIPPATAGKKLL